MKTHNRYILIVASTVALAGCGKGFQTAQNCTAGLCGSGSSGQGSGLSTGNGSTDTSVVNDLKGTIDSGQYTGLQAISIDPTTKMILLTLPLPAVAGLPTDVGAAVGKIPGATVSSTMITLPSSGNIEFSVPVIQVQIPLSAFLNGVTMADPTQIPGGAALALPSGEMPSVAFSFKSGKYPLTIYIEPKAVGVFVNTPFDPTVGITAQIQNASKTKTLGYFLSIPRSMNNNIGGFFISFRVPDDIARQLDNLL